jgi:hypothetical protein
VNSDDLIHYKTDKQIASHFSLCSLILPSLAVFFMSSNFVFHSIRLLESVILSSSESAGNKLQRRSLLVFVLVCLKMNGVSNYNNTRAFS